MRRAAAGLFALAMLAGCAATQTDTRDPNPDPNGVQPVSQGRCDPAAVQRLLGKPVTTALIETARKTAGATVARKLMPGSMVTMDYRPDRLNITVDDHERIVAIRCG